MYQKDYQEKQLPTMYDLPSEDPEEPGLPDEFHALQPQILEETFQPPNYSPEERFTAMDMNLYYDSNNTNWYKRPDWFAVVGVDRLYQKQDSRLSYVVWDELVNPLIVVELLSPGTEKEDLGEKVRKINQPPSKWDVYEKILKIPYYVIYDRYSDILLVFKLINSAYTELDASNKMIWMESIQLYLGVWHGTYKGITREWLRWYDANQKLIPLPEEEALAARQETLAARQETLAARQETLAARQEAFTQRQRAEKLAEQLRALGINPDE